MLPLLRRQLILIPLSALGGFLLAYVGLRNGLQPTVFGSSLDVGGAYNALGRVTRLNGTDVATEPGGKDRKKEEIVPDGMKVQDLAFAVENGTLGFGKLFVVNPFGDAERKDAMVLASSISRFQVEWVDGASNSVQDPKNQDIWRAHINAIRNTVEQNLSSALIMEDDLDWDIRLKEQMHTFALSARTLTQPLAIKDAVQVEFADHSFPNPLNSNTVTEIPYASRPTTIQPSHSAYGDDWDILWLGHCGMNFPNPKTNNLSKGRVVLTPDPFVPLNDTIPTSGNDSKNYPDQTRLYHHVYGPECSLAYAISQRGARRILFEVSQANSTEGIDLMLRGLCERNGGAGTKLTCLTTQPSLFSRWRAENGGSSEHVRWSVRINMAKYVRGDDREWVDQYPNENEAGGKQ